MTRRIYSSDESLNRLARILKNEIPTSDIPGSLIGEYYAWQQALSDIAELFAASLPGEALTFPNAAYGDITSDGDILASGTITAEDLVSLDDVTVTDDVFVGGDVNVSGTVTAEDGLFRDDLLVEDDYIGGGDITITGTMTSRNIALGGYLTAALMGNGDIAMGMKPTATRPSGTLTNLGGVLFAENGNLMWLGSSGTVSTVAGS